MASLSSTWRATARRNPKAQSLIICNATRYYVSKGSIRREIDKAIRQSSKSGREETMSQMQKLANAEYFRDGAGPLFPGTFVSLPLSQYPRSPAAFAQYHVSRLKHWLIGTASILNFKLKSMPSWTTRPRWKARRGKIAPTAKAMYREMLEAFAAGDKATLGRICLGDFAKKLCAAIDRRNPRQDVRFEVVKYNNGLVYPRLLSHQIHQVNPLDKILMTEQAVVAISSTQKAWKCDAATGHTIPGSLKLQDKIEYVVLSRQANSKTFEVCPWRIWGTTAATTLEAHLQEKAALETEQARRAGWTGSTTNR